MIRRWSALALAALLLASCGRGEPRPSASTANPTSAVLVYLDPSRPVEARVEDLLGRMTLDEKIGQMTQAENNSITPEGVASFLIGSVLSGGGGISDTNSITEWTDLARSYEEQALQTRLSIPLIFGVDSVHGFGHVNGATIFPHNIGLGAARDPELVRRIGQATAEEMLAAGIPWNFAPTVTVPQDIRWGRTYEGFSEDTVLVTELGAAYVRGFQSIPQGYPVSAGRSLFGGATAKHFIGDGATIWGSSTQNINGVPYMLDQGNVQAPEEALRALYLPPYQAAIDAGVMSIMASFSSWRMVKMHAQEYLLTDLLKGELGFQGFVVSDWGGIDQVDDDYYTAVVTSINAGVDMNMVPYDYVSFIAIMKQAIENGDISQERIDDAVRRILRAKFRLGLFENPYGDRGLMAAVGSPDHRALARQAVRASLVLLKNENEALPIDPDAAAILVAGRGANNTGLQAGGWTLDWQGVRSNILQGSTILDGVRASVGTETRVLYDIHGEFEDFTGPAPVGIVVTAEDPYAEGVGDRADLRLTPAEVAMIERVRLLVDRLVVVILSGRPLVITEQYPIADAWVAAWLPGSEGDGVAEVLFGKYPFGGKLPYAWPRSNEQLPLNANNASGLAGCDAPLFPLGYGLGEAGSQPIEWIDCP
jgi:beta-glucosidase